MATDIMRVDIAPYKHFSVVGGLAFLWLLINIIIGAAGPQIYDHISLYSYDCPDDDHTWNFNCSGVQLNDTGSFWYSELSGMGLLNKFWVLEMFPYTQIEDDIHEELQVQISVFGNNGGDTWYELSTNDTVKKNVDCSEGDEECSGFILVYEEFIEYSTYRVYVSLPDKDNNYFIGDVNFQYWYGHDDFSSLEIAFRVIYMVISVALFGFFFYTMKKVPLADWTWEQRAMCIMIGALVSFNNPFYGLVFAVSGWFFPFLNALFTDIFMCAILLFWLLITDKIRRDELRVEFDYWQIPKVLCVVIFGLLALILFAWTSIRDSEDPVYGDGVTGIVILFYFVVILWTAIIIWVAILLAMTVPVVTQKRYLMTRFLFFAIPTSIAIVSIFGNILAGSFGPFRQNSTSLLYFLGLYNTYVWVLTWGYWPATEAKFRVAAPSENSILSFKSGYDAL